MSLANQDEEHLRLLAIFHYVVGGITALFACFPLFHVALGLGMIFSPHFFGGPSAQNRPPAFIGWMLVALGGFFFLCGQSLAVCIIVAGRFIAQRRRYLFVFVTACVACIFMPFGTVLGIFTIIVLSRESVKRIFE